MSDLSAILSIINAVVITFALPLLTFLGVQKFYIQPRYEARNSRCKYATALYIACSELSQHLAFTFERLNAAGSGVGNAMKKIPNQDFHDNPAWFTKDGYYTTITAYKIATVSAWLRAYQNELLFSSFPESRSFLNALERVLKMRFMRPNV